MVQHIFGTRVCHIFTQQNQFKVNWVKVNSLTLSYEIVKLKIVMTIPWQNLDKILTAFWPLSRRSRFYTSIPTENWGLIISGLIYVVTFVKEHLRFVFVSEDDSNVDILNALYYFISYFEKQV